jgi:hypothetical protein
MRDSFLRSLFSSSSSRDNFINRIRANLRVALTPEEWKMSSANGAPLHLLRFDGSPHASRAQGVSFLTHAAMITALALLPWFLLRPQKLQTMAKRKSCKDLGFQLTSFPLAAALAPIPEVAAEVAGCRFLQPLENWRRSLPFSWSGRRCLPNRMSACQRRRRYSIRPRRQS